MSFAEVVVDGEAGHHGCVLFARLVHPEELGEDLPCRSGANIPPHKGHLRQRCSCRDLGGDRVAFGLIGVQQAFGRRPLITWASFHPRFTAS